MSDSEQQTSVGTKIFLRRFRALVLAGLIVWLGMTTYQNAVSPDSTQPFKLGLDLAGGSHLVYVADTSNVDPLDIPDLMSSLRDVIERRVNVFGVSEPIVQVESSSFAAEEASHRLVVELPGVTDIGEAVAEIGRTPLLEFKLYSEELAEQQASLDSLGSLSEDMPTTTPVTVDGVPVDPSLSESIAQQVEEAFQQSQNQNLPFEDTGLTGRYLETASVQFAGQNSGQLSNEPLVSVKFTKEGADLFAEITRAHVGEQLGIFLDGILLSAPVINEPITGGTAIISGDFDPEEARELARNLSFGALPVAIELQSTQTIGATLGAEVLDKGMKAGAFGFGFVLLFMIFWYRLPGFIAGLSLISYITIMLALFQWIPVTLTAAGLAGFVLSLGMAVDANVLVFERMKEEYKNGAKSSEAISSGFSRAWTAIRDGNITSLLSAIILFWFGTSMVKGFALVFGIGVIVSMFSALVITKTFMNTLPETRRREGTLLSKLLGNGLSK